MKNLGFVLGLNLGFFGKGGLIFFRAFQVLVVFLRFLHLLCSLPRLCDAAIPTFDLPHSIWSQQEFTAPAGSFLYGRVFAEEAAQNTAVHRHWVQSPTYATSRTEGIKVFIYPT